MGRIVMAWELGAGYGHLAPLLTLARPLRQAGHDVALVVRDVAAAEAVLGDAGLPFYPAPANFAPDGRLTLHSYAQILRSTAFNDAAELRARTRAWRALYEVLRPDVLVCDHAPTALLAARGLKCHCVITGNGFVVPPIASPLPELRNWEPAAPAVLEEAEAATLAITNDVTQHLGLAPLSTLADLYREATPALFTLAELDNYAALRRDAEYWGVLPGPGGEPPHWPEGSGKRVFVYGQPFKGLAEVLAALARGPHRTLAYIPRLPEKLRGLASPHLRFADTLQDIAVVTRECDAAVMTNGHSTVAAMLLAGKPLVLLPLHLEMLLISRCVEQQGAGLFAPALRPDGILRKLERVLQEPVFAERARMLAARYRDRQAPVLKFEALMTRLLAEH